MQHVRRPAIVPPLAVAVALAACGGSTAGSSAPSPPGEHVQVVLTDFQITPAEVSVSGGAVVFDVANRGKTPHNLSLRAGSGAPVGHTRDLDPGKSTTLAVHLEAGAYTSFCSLAGHESLGMRGTVTAGG